MRHTVPHRELLSFVLRTRASWASLMLALVTIAVFYPVTRNQFTSYDDSTYVTANAHVQAGLTLRSVEWAFGRLHGEETYWHPLTWISHMVDCQLFGLNPGGHHWINLLLHALNTVLVFLLFLRITGAFWRCMVLAGLFALHPLQVGTVAWVAERKNLLSALFWLLATWAYVTYAHRLSAAGSSEPGRTPLQPERHPSFTRQSGLAAIAYRHRPYLLAFTCLAFGLMCKPVLVTLPFVLLLLDVWPLQRFNFNRSISRLQTARFLLLEKTPFFALAVASCVITILAHQSLKMLVGPATGHTFAARLANAVVSYVRYLGKAVWPSNLAAFYPLPQMWPLWIVALCALLLILLSGLAWLSVRSRPYLFVGWFWFLGVLLPFIGLIQAGAQAMADRFAYVPILGLFLALVWGIHELTLRWRLQATVSAVMALTAAAACIVLTRQQIVYWKTDETLWRHDLAIIPDSDVAHYNLGVDLAARGAYDEAIGHYEQAIRLRPGQADAHDSLAYALSKQLRFTEAINEYICCLHLNPNDAEAHSNLGNLLAREGRTKEAIAQIDEALRLRPDYPEAHYNLGLVLAACGRYPAAINQFRETLRLKPDYEEARAKLERAQKAQHEIDRKTQPYRLALLAHPADPQTHENLGRVLLETDQIEEAIVESAEAARLDPTNAQIQYQLGIALGRNGQIENAAVHLKRALEIQPNLPAAHYSLGTICESQHRISDALAHWRAAAQLMPQWPEPLNKLAWLLATAPQAELRNGTEAVKLASRAVQMSGTNNSAMLDTLAAAYAEAGMYPEAQTNALQALEAATVQGRLDLAKQIRQRLALYRSNHPYHEP